MAWPADKGYDPVYGAGPLKRVIQNALEDPVAELLLAGAARDGETLAVTAGEDGPILGGPGTGRDAGGPGDGALRRGGYRGR